MKHIERISDTQRIRAEKRMKKAGYRPYWGPMEAAEFLELGLKNPRRIPLKFHPPINAEWRRW